MYLGEDNNKISVKDDNNLYYNDGESENILNSCNEGYIINNVNSWAITNDQSNIYTHITSVLEHQIHQLH